MPESEPKESNVIPITGHQETETVQPESLRVGPVQKTPEEIAAEKINKEDQTKDVPPPYVSGRAVW